MVHVLKVGLTVVTSNLAMTVNADGKKFADNDKTDGGKKI